MHHMNVLNGPVPDECLRAQAAAQPWLGVTPSGTRATKVNCPPSQATVRFSMSLLLLGLESTLLEKLFAVSSQEKKHVLDTAIKNVPTISEPLAERSRTCAFPFGEGHQTKLAETIL
jgi:hypothetical protein